MKIDFNEAVAGNDLVEALHENEFDVARQVFELNKAVNLNVRYRWTGYMPLHYAFEKKQDWLLDKIMADIVNVDLLSGVDVYSCVSRFARAHGADWYICSRLEINEKIQRGLPEDERSKAFYFNEYLKKEHRPLYPS